MEVIKNLDNLTNKLTIVDFFANWCGPCKLLAPVLEDIKIDFKDIDIFKVDVDESAELANEFNIYAVPTLIMFKDKKVVSTRQGYLTYDDLVEWIGEFKL